MENLRKKPSEEKLHMDLYPEEAKKDVLPHKTQYEFLLERNKPYMNYTAISSENGEKVTYEELHTRIDEYARALYKKGVREGDVVALGVSNTPQNVYVSLALNKLGAVITPINLTYNNYKIQRDLEISKPKFYIGVEDGGKFKQASEEMDIVELYYGNEENIRQHESLKNVINKGKDYENPVYPGYKQNRVSDIMFTGGSTGTHKGVDLLDDGLCGVIKALDYSFNMEPGDNFLGNLPQFMAFGKMSLFYALCKSCNVHLTDKAYPPEFFDELMRTDAQGAMGGPIHWEYALLYNPKLKKDCLKALKFALSGGEQLKYDKEISMNKALEYAGALTKIWVGIGMTETWAPTAIKRGGLDRDHTVGIMLPFMNSKIVNPETGEELSYNEAGEWYISSPGNMAGYHDNPEETKKSLRYDENGEKWFKTGDLTRQGEDGRIDYLGRLKRSFVCGWENIYPEQIENLVCGIPGVREVIVTKIPDDNLQFLPKYHISLVDNCTTSFEELERQIKELISSTLGELALPCECVFYFEPLPRTDRDKLDPKPLQEQDLKELEEQKSKKKVNDKQN